MLATFLFLRQNHLSHEFWKIKFHCKCALLFDLLIDHIIKVTMYVTMYIYVVYKDGINYVNKWNYYYISILTYYAYFIYSLLLITS